MKTVKVVQRRDHVEGEHQRPVVGGPDRRQRHEVAQREERRQREHEEQGAGAQREGDREHGDDRPRRAHPRVH
jgi:hypothetical protein